MIVRELNESKPFDEEMRMQKDLSQDDVALHLNLSKGYIGHIESPNFRAILYKG